VERNYTAKDAEDFAVEFLIRQGADALFKQTESIIKKNIPAGEYPDGWAHEYSEDLVKKVFRAAVKEVYKEETKKDTNISPEN
jgi:hypothetical protein